MGSEPWLSKRRPSPKRRQNSSNLSLSEYIEALLHGTIFPGDLNHFGARLNDQVTVVAKAFGKLHYIRKFQTEEPPITMLNDCHIAQSGEVKLVQKVKSDIFADRKFFDGPLRSFALVEQA